ncbi:MAG: hypothetical protein WCG85_08890 [Polyangia bacterium]
MRHLHRNRYILRLIAALVFPFLLTVGGSCTAPAVGDLFHPIPPPDPTIGSSTVETDSDGLTHTYWRVTGPPSPSSDYSYVWVYLTNIDRGLGVSVQADQDGAYATQVEGQQGDQIIFGFGAPYNDTMCRPLREGLANVPCQ